MPTPSGELRVLGGLDLAGGTVSTSYLLAPTTGAVGPAASLAEPTHDAAGTLLGSSALVVGGGSVAPAAAVQLAPASATATVTVSGQLTVARADARAVTIGDTAYVVGGYDGPSMDTAVLATTDGRVFRQVATLPVPVRYPTLAVADGVVYVLGGQNAAGAPVPTVQEIDPHSGRAVVTGSLGVPLAASVATTVDGTIYLAGGLVTGPGGIVPTTAVFAYRPGAADVQHVATLPVAVANAGAARLGTRLYVLGGENAAGTPVDNAQVVTFTHGPAASARPASGPGR